MSAYKQQRRGRDHCDLSELTRACRGMLRPRTLIPAPDYFADPDLCRERHPSARSQAMRREADQRLCSSVDEWHRPRTYLSWNRTSCRQGVFQCSVW